MLITVLLKGNQYDANCRLAYKVVSYPHPSI